MGVAMKEDEDRSPKTNARDAAIQWWVTSRAGFSRQERAEFEAWRAADPAHAAAYADIEQTYAHVKRVRRAGRDRRRAAPPRRMPGAAAAAFAMAAVLAILIAVDPIAIFLRADFLTGTGETRTVTLADGSRVTLGARSALAVRFSPQERRLALLRGEAWFEAAHGVEAPFVVEAAGGTVTALGTSFDVDIIDSGVRVAVGEHAVRVDAEGRTVVVGENEQTKYAAGAPPAPPSPAPRSLAAWRRGNLIFEDRPLGEVLAALGRYRRGLVYCVPAAICARPVTAVLPAADPRQALREIELFLGLRSARLTDYLVLLYE
jgi:transmembrane sensor